MEARSFQVLPVYSGAVVSGEVLDEPVNIENDFCEPPATTGTFDPDIEPINGDVDVGWYEVGFFLDSLRHGDAYSCGLRSQRQ